MADDIEALKAEVKALRGDHMGGWFWSQSEWADWSNTLALLLPEEYDGDEAQEAIIERALTDLVALAARHDADIAAAKAAGAAEVIARVEALAIDHWQTGPTLDGKRHGYIDIDDLRAALTTGGEG